MGTQWKQREFIFLGSKITADGDCSNEIKRHLLLGRNAMSNILTYARYMTNARQQWHPTPALLPGKSHGWRSLVGCSPWGRKKMDTRSNWTELSWYNLNPFKTYINFNIVKHQTSIMFLQLVTTAMKLKDVCFLEESYDTILKNLDTTLKSRDTTLPTKVRLVKLWFFQ